MYFMKAHPRQTANRGYTMCWRARLRIFSRATRPCADITVSRRGGWDTHGLPVEIEVEKEIGLHQQAAN